MPTTCARAVCTTGSSRETACRSWEATARCQARAKAPRRVFSGTAQCECVTPPCHPSQLTLSCAAVFRTAVTVRRTVLIANNIRLLSKDASHLAVTDNDVQHIKKVRACLFYARACPCPCSRPPRPATSAGRQEQERVRGAVALAGPVDLWAEGGQGGDRPPPPRRCREGPGHRDAHPWVRIAPAPTPLPYALALTRSPRPGLARRHLAHAPTATST